MKKTWLKRDRRGEMGVGTMIIFIAMILVAAVAASVLIGTANKVREQAQNTGDQAINNVASGFVIQDVTGTVNAGFTEITELTIQLRLQAGSPSMNMNLVSIQVVSDSANTLLGFAAGSSTSSGAIADSKYGANTTGSSTTWTGSNRVVEQGDLITVTITGLDLGYSATATVKIVPAYGSSTSVSFVTPSLYSTTLINLR
ncbi:MAG: archaellin/type IV pilin N-terminal domain-containing protein [Methanomassiliicoccales archaeon]|jgi:flagellin FlaB